MSTTEAPLNEVTEIEEAPAVQEEPSTVPPWERDGETFDPERAWKLIQNLKAELARVKAKPAEAPEPAAEEPEQEPEAEPAEAETSSESQDDSAAQIASLQAELARVKALAAVGLPQDFAPFVPGASSEEIEKNLATLQKLISDAANEKTEAVLAAAPKSRGMAPTPHSMRRRHVTFMKRPQNTSSVDKAYKPLLPQEGLYLYLIGGIKNECNRYS